MAGAGADPVPYLAASAVSALVTFPFWKAATIGQSGYALQAKTTLGRLWEVAKPPWRGSLVVVSGMTWARAAILFGSDEGSRLLQTQGWGVVSSTAVPPLLISMHVQIANQPFVRSSVMLQGDPQVSFAASTRLPNLAVLRHLQQTKGARAWWLGTGVGIARTVPKYVIAVAVKDFMDRNLAPVDGTSSSAAISRSVKKSIAAGMTGAVLTNPLDVLQNEMFKTEQNPVSVFKRLCREEGWRWLLRGVERNVLATALPIATCFFLTDQFASSKRLHV
mmetsp:Transcript_72240/g.156839  ORF Transcript_72240/g.156839 Transcript_72240/m.156839 type:complete len:277 (-) Transcript_72240:130-960(-)